MRILVTGAGGQVGSELMEIIASRPHHEAFGVGRGEADLTDRDEVLGLITSTRPELILHCAAMTAVDNCESDPDAAYRINSVGTRFVADGARRIGAHVVYVSTDYVFDGEKNGAYLEWDPPNPRSVYGKSKLGGEMEIDPAWTIARTSWVCGYHGQNMVKTLLRLADGGGEVSFVDDQVGKPTFAADLAQMILKLGVERVPGVFHTTNSGAVSWYDFARIVFEAVDADPDRVSPISTVDLDPPRPAPRPANSVLEDFAWRSHGFDPARDFREPLAELLGRLRP